VAVIAVVSAAAGMIPAHRASRIDPILALRYESALEHPEHPELLKHPEPPRA